MNPDAEWAKWQTWLGQEPKGRTIYAQVVEMLAWRQVWDSFAVIHDAAPPVAKEYGTFVVWTRWNYARSQGLALRRQADMGRDVVSLARLIDRVWRYPTVLSLDRYRQQQNEADPAWWSGKAVSEVREPSATTLRSRRW